MYDVITVLQLLPQRSITGEAQIQLVVGRLNIYIVHYFESQTTDEIFFAFQSAHSVNVGPGGSNANVARTKAAA